MLGAKNVCGGHTSSRGADIECLRKLNKLGSRGIDTAQKDRNLKPKARGSTPLGRIHALAFLEKFYLHNRSLSTAELVRLSADWLPHEQEQSFFVSGVFTITYKRS